MNDRFEAKLDKLIEHAARTDVHLERYNVLLDEHIKRSTQLEDRVKPIEKHVAVVGAVGSWLLGGGGVAVLMALVRLLLQ